MSNKKFVRVEQEHVGAFDATNLKMECSIVVSATELVQAKFIRIIKCTISSN